FFRQTSLSAIAGSGTDSMTAFDEMSAAPAGNGVRPPYQAYKRRLAAVQADLLARRRLEADLLFRRPGITFAVYGEGADTERLIPFDMVPRILAAKEWRRLRRGLKQRVRALNAFLHDVYHEQAILKSGTIPADLILRNTQYTAAMRGIAVAGDIYTHIAGIDV